MSDMIQKGLANGIFSFNEDKTYIIYNTKQKSDNKRPYNEAEEKIRAEFLTKLVLEYEYPLSHIEVEVSVKIGIDKKRADIIIYKDEKHKKAYIIVETKTKDYKDLQSAKLQALSYAHATGGEYAIGTNGKESIFVHLGEHEDRTIENIPRFGGDAPKYKYIRGGEHNDIKPTTTDELQKVLGKIHDYLWNGGKRNPAEAFNEFSKIVFTKIMDEKIAEYDPAYQYEHYEFQKDRDETKYQLADRIKELYKRYKDKDPNVFDDTLILDADEITFLVETLEGINLNKTDLDIKGRVFQKFFADFFKGDAGQYFTPMNVVRFMVSLFDLQKDDLVIDPSCGSGGFLLQALLTMQEKAKKLKDPLKQHLFWHSFAEKNLYGIEISGGISRTAKMNMIIHDDGHTNVITHDGLDRLDKMQTKNLGFQKNRFDYIFTNPPFGSSIPSTKPYFSSFEKFSRSTVDYIDALIDNKKTKDLSNQKSEILFIERYYELLKEGGKVAVVLPDGILTNSSMQNVRDYILEKFRLLASFSLPQHTFSNYGAGVKSSILVLQKKTAEEESTYLETQDRVRLKHVNAHKDEILSIRKELKDKLGKLDKKADDFKEKEAELKEEYKLKEEIVRDRIYEAVNAEMSKAEKYKIFMAIIDEIGEDATGKKTCEYENTELYKVAEQFKEFCINFH